MECSQPGFKPRTRNLQVYRKLSCFLSTHLQAPDKESVGKELGASLGDFILDTIERARQFHDFGVLVLVLCVISAGRRCGKGLPRRLWVGTVDVGDGLQ